MNIEEVTQVMRILNKRFENEDVLEYARAARNHVAREVQKRFASSSRALQYKVHEGLPNGGGPDSLW